MNMAALMVCLDGHHRQASLTFMLDEELGVLHGISWADFVLLNALDVAGGSLSTAELASSLCMPRSRLLIQLMPLEKTGLVARALRADGGRRVSLRPNGQRHVAEARETAGRLCEKFLGIEAGGDNHRMSTVAGGTQIMSAG